MRSHRWKRTALLAGSCRSRAGTALSCHDLESYRRMVAQTAFQARDVLREQPTGWWPSDPTDKDLNEVQIGEVRPTKPAD
jgi:hypothetical protein